MRRCSARRMCGSWIAWSVVGWAVAPAPARAQVARVEVTERRPWLDGRPLGPAGPYELVRGTVRYELDPDSRAARDVADVRLAPRNARGRVEYGGPFVVIRPADPARANGVTLVEVANRGTTQMDRVFFHAADGFQLTDAFPKALVKATVFEHGYTLAWVAWEGRMKPGSFGLDVPVSSAHGPVRADFNAADLAGPTRSVDLRAQGFYCARDAAQPRAVLRRTARFDDPGQPVPRSGWAFARADSGGALVPDPCRITLLRPPADSTEMEVVYDGEDAAVMGLGEAAVRDFAAHLKFADVASPLNEPARRPRAVLAYGYSQSGRFLRDFLYHGFNADARGRRVFDGMIVAAAGAGRGSFDHRYALPGEAGNSVMSHLRPVDLYPFADVATPDVGGGRPEGLLDRARRDGVVPKIFTVFGSSEYWARAGSLVQTTTDGRAAVPLDPNDRLYVFTGSPHAPMRPALFRSDGTRARFPYNYAFDFAHAANPLLDHLRRWVVDGVEPPASRAPALGTTLVDPASLRAPGPLAGQVPPAPPPVWRLDFGPRYAREGVVAEPPVLGPRYRLLVPAVNADGNEVGGVRGLTARAPLGTYTAWNRDRPEVASFGYLSGLHGAFVPFARTKAERVASGDPRPSIEERYGDRQGYLAAVGRAFDELAREGLADPSERDYALESARRGWGAVEEVWSGAAPAPAR